MDDQRTFGSRMREAMEANGVTGAQLAEWTKCSSATVSNYKNDCFMPTIKTAAKIADVLGVSMDWLCGIDRAECDRHTEHAVMLNRLAQVVHDDAVAHGLFGRADPHMSAVTRRKEAAYRVMDELRQTIDAARDRDAFAEELADVILVALSYAVELHIDIGNEVEKKRLINIDRPQGHKEVDDDGDAAR